MQASCWPGRCKWLHNEVVAPGHEAVAHPGGADASMQVCMTCALHATNDNLAHAGMLDPLVPLPYPSALFVREKAMVVNLESVRMLVTKDQASDSPPACSQQGRWASTPRCRPHDPYRV